MKKLFLIFALGIFTLNASAQNNASVKFPGVDASPLDVVYYPLNATKVKKEDNSSPIIRVLYSRPSKKGREIFGTLEQFDKVWRLGANENTEIDFFVPVTIGDKKIKAGRYSLFAIPSKDKWTIIVNKQTDRWGAFTYDETKDIVRVDVPVAKPEKPLEMLSMTFIEAADGANLVIAWDNTQTTLPIQFKK